MFEPLSPAKFVLHQNAKSTDDSPPQDLDWNDPATRMALGLEFVEKYLEPSEVVALRVVCKAFDQALCSAGFYWIDRIKTIPFSPYGSTWKNGPSHNARLSLLRGFGHGNRLPVHHYPFGFYPDDLIENGPDLFALITHLDLYNFDTDSIPHHFPLPHNLINLEISFDRPMHLTSYHYALLEQDTLLRVTLDGCLVLDRPYRAKCKGPDLCLILSNDVVGEIIIPEGLKRLSLKFDRVRSDGRTPQARISAPHLDLLRINLHGFPPPNLSLLTGCSLSAELVWLNDYGPIGFYDRYYSVCSYLKHMPLEVLRVWITPFRENGAEYNFTRNDDGRFLDDDGHEPVHERLNRAFEVSDSIMDSDE